jgi:beta-glucanase (GH16 family)
MTIRQALLPGLPVYCILAFFALAAAEGRGYVGRGVFQPGWRLLWQDDFIRYERSKWSAQQGDGCHLGICGWGNGELQFYTNRSRNLRVEDGRLFITARHETGEDLERLQRHCRSLCNSGDTACRNRCAGARFSSARIRTLDKFSVGPGSRGYSKIKVTTRFKVSPGAALWPAIWMLPQYSDSRCSGCGRYGGWASSGEIDIFEAKNDMKEVSVAWSAACLLR